jgi:3-methyladenine DNA glycosylase AlkD
MTLDQAMSELEKLGSEPMREFNRKHGAGENQFGVKMGEIRALAKRVKTDHELGLALWKTGNLEAMLLATLVLNPKMLSSDDVDRMVREMPHYRESALSQLGEWLMTNVVKPHPHKEQLRQKWMADQDPLAARFGWGLTAQRVAKEPEGLDLTALLERIEREMGSAPAPTQWTMNFTLGEIGIGHPEHRERAVAIGEKLGVYKDYPTSKGCTSPYVPTWVQEMVRRQG